MNLLKSLFYSSNKSYLQSFENTGFLFRVVGSIFCFSINKLLILFSIKQPHRASEMETDQAVIDWYVSLDFQVSPCSYRRSFTGFTPFMQAQLATHSKNSVMASGFLKYYTKCKLIYCLFVTHLIVLPFDSVCLTRSIQTLSTATPLTTGLYPLQTSARSLGRMSIALHTSNSLPSQSPLCRMLDEFFRVSLGKKVDVENVDVNEIGKSLSLSDSHMYYLSHTIL